MLAVWPMELLNLTKLRIKHAKGIWEFVTSTQSSIAIQVVALIDGPIVHATIALPASHHALLPQTHVPDKGFPAQFMSWSICHKIGYQLTHNSIAWQLNKQFSSFNVVLLPRVRVRRPLHTPKHRILNLFWQFPEALANLLQRFGRHCAPARTWWRFHEGFDSLTGHPIGSKCWGILVFSMLVIGFEHSKIQGRCLIASFPIVFRFWIIWIVPTVKIPRSISGLSHCANIILIIYYIVT